MTEVELKDCRAAALRYRGIEDDAQPAPDDFGESRVRKIRNEVVEQTIALLTKNACDPARIGRRVLVFEWVLEDRKNIKSASQKELAQRFGVSEGRISQMLSSIEDGLLKIMH